VAAVVGAFHERLGLRPGRVYLVAPGALPLTANGKLRHGELRRLYVEGEMRRAGRWCSPPSNPRRLRSPR